MVGIAVDSGHAALTKLGIDDKAVLALMGENAAKWARENSAAMVGMKYDDNGDLVPNSDVQWQITDSTRDMIRSLTAEAVDDGWSTDEFADALSGNYAFSEERAQTIARTETAKADVAGHIEGWKASGQVAQKEWLVSDGCCDECQALDGEIVDIDDPFPDDGGDGPPLHPNCRCTVLPVLTSADDSSSGDSANDGE